MPEKEKKKTGRTGAAYPEDVRCRALVRGLQSHEGDAVVQRRVAQHAGPEDGVFGDVARRVDARENVRQALLDRFGVPVPRQLLRAGLLHFTLRRRDGGDRREAETRSVNSGRDPAGKQLLRERKKKICYVPLKATCRLLEILSQSFISASEIFIIRPQ